MTDMVDYKIHQGPTGGNRSKEQEIYRFPNGYGASILDGEEVAVIKFGDGDVTDVFDWDWAPTEKTGITTQHGVIFIYQDEEITALLEKIKEIGS